QPTTGGSHEAIKRLFVNCSCFGTSLSWSGFVWDPRQRRLLRALIMQETSLL
ncbi:hypothetical protein ILYODFUR_011882, partial [Ilyodon furcidens]